MDNNLDVLQDTGLGRPLAGYRRSLLGGLGALGIGLLLGLVAAPLGVVTGIATLAKEGLASLLNLESLFLLACLPLWFLGGLSVVFTAISGRRDYVATHERGFSFRLPPRSPSLPSSGLRTWDQIDKITHSAIPFNDSRGQYQRTLHSFTIACQGQPEVDLDQGIMGVSELGRFIQDAVRERLLAIALAGIQGQEEVSFGPLRVSQREIGFQGSALAWPNIASITLESRIARTILFKIRTEIEDIVIAQFGAADPWAVIPVSEVPNEFVLIDLANRLLPSPTDPDAAA